MKKVVIIEDSLYDYQKLTAILSQYEIEYYPKPTDFASFSQLLANYVRLPEEETLDHLREILKEFEPDYFLLDIGLNYNKKGNDRSGLLLKSVLLDKYFSGVPIYLISAKTGISTHEANFIYKKSNATLAGEISKKFLQENGIRQRQYVNGLASTSKENTSFNMSDELEMESNLPKCLETIKRFEFYKVGPWIQFAIDRVITYLFYLSLLGLAVGGPVMILIEAIETHFKLLLVAETAFIAFLPLLVVFGFYVFYTQSLRPIIMEADPDIDFDVASRLMMLTKKLFISSLISYLFTKMIEFLFLEKPTEHKKVTQEHTETGSEAIKNLFNNYHNTDTPLAQLYVTGGVILILILFYIYLNHHQNHAHHQPEDQR